jgi:mono/diheme cytochrome c family protein
MTSRTVALVGLLLLTGCQQQMARQPAYRPLEASSFFADGSASRPLVHGTVHRDARREVGKKPDPSRIASVISAFPGNPWTAAQLTEIASYVDDFPAPLTPALLQRGQERFNIYCSVCHDRVGTGNGMIVQRGYTRPPNFHTDLSRGFKYQGIQIKLTDVPVGYIFDVITNGFGAMPDYAAQVPPEDRWAIIGYIRALQLSQAATLDDVRKAEERKKLEATRGPKK